MPQLSVMGRTIGYEVQPPNFDKSKLTVVFVHGTGGDREDWRDQLNGLSGAANMLALELPGHGTSEPPGESSVPAFARWVTDFINELGLKKVMVVGCSLGSAIAQWIALNANEPWLVAIGLVGAGARLRVHPAFLQGLKDDAPKALTMLADYCLSDAPDTALREKIRDKLVAQSPDLIFGDLYACNEFDVMEKIEKIRLPTCIIVGEQDKLTPVKYSKYLNEVINGSQLSVIPNAGHLASMERPAEFNKSLGDFLKALPEP